MNQDQYDYIRCHMPSGRVFEARIPSLLSREEMNWLLVLVSLLDTNADENAPDDDIERISDR